MNDNLTGEILMEYTLVGGAFTVKAVNMWGLGLISSNREGVKWYFHFDALGSTRALTDSTGSVTDTYEYNAFGVLESSTGTSANPFRFGGEHGIYDDGAMGSASALLAVGSVYYSSVDCRFLTRPYQGAGMMGMGDGGTLIPIPVTAYRPPPEVGGPPTYRCCRDLLIPEINPKIPRGLLECLASADQDREQIVDCFRKYGGKKAGEIAQKALCEYIGCYYVGRLLDLYHPNWECVIDVCTLGPLYCHECCGSKYYACLCKAAGKSAQTIGRCWVDYRSCVGGCS